MWFSGILLAAVVMSTAVTAIPGYGTYLEDPFSRNTLLSDPAFARMAAEYGATFQKTSVVTTACGKTCVVDFGDEKHLLYLNEEVADPEDPCLIYTCTANEVTTKNVKADCTPVDQIKCENGGRPVRLPDRCCATNCTGSTGPNDEFSTWSEYTPCSRTCGKAFTARRRECEIVNGLVVECVGEKIEVEECNLGPCPVNCTWTWSEFTPCSATCGTGTRTRTRIIVEPAKHGGFCPPRTTQTLECIGESEGEVCTTDDGRTICDNDGDCIPREQDNCEDVYNIDQDDEDGDGVGDKCDNCIFATNKDQRNDDGDTTGNACDEDDDNDGKPDPSDNCGTIYNPNQRDQDGDDVGDCCDDCTKLFNRCFTMDTLQSIPDTDGDGIKDPCDTCPTIANKNQTDRPCNSMFTQSLNNDKKGLAAEIMEKLMEMYYSN